jgi:hypothetical protein
MANPAITVNNRLTLTSVADVDAYFARQRPKDTTPAGTEDVPAFTNTNASQRTNSRMSLA